MLKKLAVIFIILAGVVFVIFNQNSKEHVKINKSGFHPRSITISSGTSVIWNVDDDGAYWPASNFHPTHSNYPEDGGCIGSLLDACRALKKGESYKFVFRKEGVWSLHDHLNPELIMQVNVKDGGLSAGLIDKIQSFFQSESNKQSTQKKEIGKPSSLFNNKQKQIISEISKNLSVLDTTAKAYEVCDEFKNTKFRDILHCYTETYYVIASHTDTRHAFRSLTELGMVDPRSRQCHIIAHGIGWAAFERNPDEWKDTVSKMSPDCSYGGVHGVVERYSFVSGKSLDAKTIPQVCGKDPTWGCVHAIGHVLLVQTGNDLPQTLSLCKNFAGRVAMNCLNGAYMESMIAQNLADHGMVSQSRRDSFHEHLYDFEKMCREATGDDATACWTEIIHAAANYFNADTQQVFDLCASAQTVRAQASCRRHALADLMGKKGFDLMLNKNMCTIPQENDQSFEGDCYVDLATITMSNLPSRLNEVISYCSSLDEKYQAKCFSKIESALVVLKRYDPSEVKNLCSTVSSKNEICDKVISGRVSRNQAESIKGD